MRRQLNEYDEKVLFGKKITLKKHKFGFYFRAWLIYVKKNFLVRFWDQD